MTRLPASVLLLPFCCLLSRPANSQPAAPLRPAVVTLDSGTTLRRPLIGLTPATYGALRQERALDAQLLAVRAARISALERDSLLAALAGAIRDEELRRCRAGLAARDADFDQLAAVARQAAARPSARPLLLDAHTYQGAAGGALLLLALGFILRP